MLSEKSQMQKVKTAYFHLLTFLNDEIIVLENRLLIARFYLGTMPGRRTYMNIKVRQREIFVVKESSVCWLQKLLHLPTRMIK